MATWQTRMDSPTPRHQLRILILGSLQQAPLPPAPEFSLAARGLVRLITDLGRRTMILHHDVGFVRSLFDTLA